MWGEQLTCSSTESCRTFHKNSIMAIIYAKATPTAKTIKIPPTFDKAKASDCSSATCFDKVSDSIEL